MLHVPLVGRHPVLRENHVGGAPIGRGEPLGELALELVRQRVGHGRSLEVRPSRTRPPADPRTDRATRAARRSRASPRAPAAWLPARAGWRTRRPPVARAAAWSRSAAALCRAPDTSRVPVLPTGRRASCFR